MWPIPPVPIAPVAHCPCDWYPCTPYPCAPLPMWLILHVLHTPSTLLSHVPPLPMWPIPTVPHTPVPYCPMCPHCPCTPYPMYPIVLCAPLPMWSIPPVPIAPVAHCPCDWYPCTPYPCAPIAHVADTPCTPYPLYPIAPCAPIAHVANTHCTPYPCTLFTLSKVQKIRVILGRSENSFSLLQWLSMGKQILKHKTMEKTYIPKIILHNYILYKGDPTYIGTLPVDSGMPLIFTDFQHSTWCRPTSCWKICEYQSHP